MKALTLSGVLTPVPDGDLCYTDHGSYFWTAVSGSPWVIKKWDFASFTLQWTASLQSGYMCGAMVSDGTYLWAIEQQIGGPAANVLKINLSTGSILARTAFPTYTMRGITGSYSGWVVCSDGTSFWAVRAAANSGSPSSPQLYQVNSSASIVNTYSLTYTYTSDTPTTVNTLIAFAGSLWLGEGRWVTDNTGVLYRINPSNGAKIASWVTTSAVANHVFTNGIYVLLQTQDMVSAGWELQQVDPSTNIMTSVETASVSNSINSTTAYWLWESAGYFWVALRNGGVMRVRKTSTITPYSHDMEAVVPSANAAQVVHFIAPSTVVVLGSAGGSFKVILVPDVTIVPGAAWQHTSSYNIELNCDVMSSYRDFPFTAVVGQPYNFTVDSTVEPNAYWSGGSTYYPSLYVLDPNENMLAYSGYLHNEAAETLNWTASSSGSFILRIYDWVFSSGPIAFTLSYRAPGLPGPVANYHYSPGKVVVENVVTFTDTSTGTPLSWAWDFGDTGTSVLQNPTHTYTTPGDYTVSLTVTNASGSDTITRTIHVQAAPPSSNLLGFLGHTEA